MLSSRQGWQCQGHGLLITNPISWGHRCLEGVAQMWHLTTVCTAVFSCLPVDVEGCLSKERLLKGSSLPSPYTHLNFYFCCQLLRVWLSSEAESARVETVPVDVRWEEEFNFLPSFGSWVCSSLSARETHLWRLLTWRRRMCAAWH